MTRRVYASQHVFLPMAWTHANALSTEAAQNGMARRAHLSKSFVVSPVKRISTNHGKRTTLRSGVIYKFPRQFFVLKLFPGFRLCGSSHFGTPYETTLNIYFLLEGPACFLIGGRDYDPLVTFSPAISCMQDSTLSPALVPAIWPSSTSACGG